MRDEMRLHIELEAERLRNNGLDPDEARRQAHVRFGGVEKFKAEGRDARGFAWLDSVSLDARLGVRMLAKHRWLTGVGGVAMAVAIALGASAFEVIGVLLRDDLPFPGGDRAIAIRYVSSSSAGADERVLHAFAAWRGQVKTVEHLGAFRTLQHNLIAPNAPPEPIEVAEISASAFVLVGTPPLQGRYLLPSDEQEQAAPVIVLGYDAWRRRFGADPAIVGRTVPLGGVPTTIVGIMPEGFAFPISHEFWIPLRLNPLKWRPWEGPALDLFGRLAPGATLEQAQGELASIGRQVADLHPDGAGRVQPVVLPFPEAHRDLEGPLIVFLMRAAQFLVGALSFLVAINLAVLLYARTITRLGEIAVRTALGASRGAHPLAAVRRSARAHDTRRGRRSGNRTHRAAAGGGDGGCGSVLVEIQPRAEHHPLRVRARDHGGVHHGCAARDSKRPDSGCRRICQELHGRTGTRTRLDVVDDDRGAGGCRGGDPASGGVSHLVCAADGVHRPQRRRGSHRAREHGLHR